MEDKEEYTADRQPEAAEPGDHESCSQDAAPDGAEVSAADAELSAAETESAGPNKKRRTLKLAWYWSLLLVILAVVITFFATYGTTYVVNKAYIDQLRVNYSGRAYYNTAVIDRIKAYYDEYYVGEYGSFDPESYMYLAMDYVLDWDSETITDVLASIYVARSGDKYGAYYNAEDYADLIKSYSGSSVGIGVYVRFDSEAGYVEVLYVFEDGPAYKAGIQAGDYIVGVDGRSFEGMEYEQVLSSIAGEEGSSATVSVMREGEKLDLPVTRATYTVRTVFYHMNDDGKTGVIRITSFDDTTPTQFREAVDSLTEAGAERFVFDLRGNGGGLVRSVLGVLSYIFPKDTPIMREVDKNGGEEIQYSDDDHVMDCPMAVLTDGDTASASELFTINMRDYEKAIIVGEKTYGKGVEQRFFSLPNGGRLKMTCIWYSSVLSDNYDGKGITPDVEAKLAEEYANVNAFKLEDKNDAVLIAAIENLNK